MLYPVPEAVRKGRIKMKTRRILSVMLACLTLVWGAAGPTLAESTPAVEHGTLGQVTQIDGNSITIALATTPNPGDHQTPQGNPPSGDSGQTPQGNPPSGDNGQNGPGGGNGGLTLTGETLTFTVDDATQITLSGGRDVQGTALALSDIQMGDVVTVTLGGSAATAITVRRMPAAPEATQTPSEK